MRKITRIFSLLLVLTIGLFSTTSCNNKNTIVIGTMSQPGEPIINNIIKDYEELGYEVEIKLFNDFNTPNIALYEGTIDANLFQHEPFLDAYNKSNNTDLFCAAKLYDCVYGGYSKKSGINSISDIPNGAKITVANDSSNLKRCLKILEAEGLIELSNTLPDTLAATDINDYINVNAKNLIITPIQTSLIAASLDDQDVYLGLVNATFAIQAGLSSAELICEEKDPTHINANILAIRNTDKEEEWASDLVKVLTSDTSKSYIEEQFKGAIRPYFVSNIF